MHTAGGGGVEFLHLDAAGGLALPSGDIYVIRQVLQHLTNNDIGVILDRVLDRNPRFLAVFEEALVDPHEVNLDMPSCGPFTRGYVNSSVDLRVAPFSLPLERLTAYPHPESPRSRSELAFYWWEKS